MAKRRTIYPIGAISCAIWLACTAVILNKSHLQDMCYLNGEVWVSPQEVKNSTGPCSHWRRTCCNAKDEAHIKEGKRINFHPCDGHKMSNQCERHFKRKLCFQNCSPYIGPWILNLNESRSRTQFRYIPLCRSQCELWWKDCKHDFAKQENWYPGRKGKYENAICQTIENKYKDATYFCEHAFEAFEFLVVPDYTECMSIFGDVHNNKFVAMTYAERVLEHRWNNDFPGDTTTPTDSSQSNAVPTKFLILCFFLGGIIAAVGFVLGCLLLSKCRTTVRRGTSHHFLFQNRDDYELEEPELTTL